MLIHCNFDGGNIEVVNAENPDNIQLAIRKDLHADYRQWFYFKVSQAKDTPCQFSLVNANEASYVQAWDGCPIVASYDRDSWFRVETQYDGKLHFSLTPEQDVVYFAFFAPYSYERHQDLIGWALLDDRCELAGAAATVENRQIEILQIGDSADEKKNIWINQPTFVKTSNILYRT